MKNSFFIVFLTLLSFHTSIAQGISGKVVDSKNGESISYATVKINDSQSLVTNTEGFFTVPENENKDSTVLTVSYLGYVSKRITVGELKRLQFIITLQHGVYELETVNVSNVKPDPYKIIAEVNKNLNQNYKTKLNNQPLKETLFYRETDFFKPEILDFEITQATGATKKGLKVENQELRNFTSQVISYPPKGFDDMLCNYYTATKTKDDKSTIAKKLEVVKAVKISGASFDDIEKKAMNIITKHLDSTKYYRAKTGWFGTRDTVLSPKNSNKTKVKKKVDPFSRLNSSKLNLYSFMSGNNILNSHKLNFIRRPDLYEYTYEGVAYSNDNEFLYILNFKPKKSSAKYTGKLYISEKDYAVQRIDYTLDEGETEGGLNLKWILGIKFSQNYSKGTIVYKQSSFESGYHLHYASVETGFYAYIHRPVKFIELTDKKNGDVVAFDLKVEANSKSKIEFLNVSRGEITEGTFDKIKEEEFDYTYMRQYDPKIWKDFTVIEPLEEMKQFHVLDN